MEEVFDFVAGWGAGAIGLAIGHPLDTVKTIQQMDNRSQSNFKVMARIMKSQGIVGFYRGMMFPLVSAGTLNSVFFGVYGKTLRALQILRGHNRENILSEDITVYEDTFIAGCIGGVFQTVMACPSEFIKVRMQTGQEYFSVEDRTFAKSRTPSGRSTFKIILDAYHNLGVKGLYTGFVPMLLRTETCPRAEYTCWLTSTCVITCTVIWSFIPAFSRPSSPVVWLASRVHIVKNIDHHRKRPMNIAMRLSGTISWIPVVPLDTIKSRIQADDPHNPLYKGTIDCAIKLFRLGGVSIFFRGFLVIAVRSFPVNASVFLGYDTIVQCLKYFLAN